MKVSIIAKLAILAANKFSHMDPLGMGLEMEAGKPGWNDAMNGLPGLFGSEMPSAYELHEIVDFVGTVTDVLGKSSGVFGKMLARMDQGIERALTYAPDKDK